MASITQIQVNRSNLGETRIVTFDAPELNPGEVLVQIDQVAMTANNVTYAVSGDMIGYWGFYPTGEDGWGIVPVWGYGTVVKSACDTVTEGEEIYGFWPMASHVVLQPDHAKTTGFIDGMTHRASLPGLYNQYTFKSSEPEFLHGRETERALFFPLFVTSYLLYDYLADNDFFNAGQVVIGSASSKTGFGLAHALAHHDGDRPQIVGVTSPGNRAFTESLGTYDKVICYGEETQLDPSLATAYVDMSGNAALTKGLHTHHQDKLVESCMVGATHWTAFGSHGELPGAKPTLFFAPSQIEKRDGEWGRGIIMDRALKASAAMAERARDWVDVERVNGSEAAAALWSDLVNGKVSPRRGLMFSL